MDTIPDVLTPTFERINITERACIRKVEFNDIIAVVQRHTQVWPQ